MNQHLWKEPFSNSTRDELLDSTSNVVAFYVLLEERGENPGPDILRVDFDLDDYKRRWGL